LVEVDEDAPTAGDDAHTAKFYDLKNVLESKKESMAFDHYGILDELVKKKYSEIYV
jgi:hypothetical protein